MFYDTYSGNKRFLALKAKIPYEFRDEKNLLSAVTRNGAPHDFYHLETIGDSIINMVVKTTLGITNPGWSSGQITQESQRFLRNIGSHTEAESVLCQIAGHFGLKEYFGNYDTFYKGRDGLAHTYAGAVEALVGAVFYDSGHDLETTKAFVLKLYAPFELIKDKTCLCMPEIY